MDKSFRSLARDPWNKLKVYFCLRMIELENESDKRALLLIGLADARKRMDPVLSLTLCEAALKLAPHDPDVLRHARSLLSRLTSGASGAGHDKADAGSNMDSGPDTRLNGSRSLGTLGSARRPGGRSHFEDQERRRLDEEAEEADRLRREEEDRRRREEEERLRLEEEDRRRREQEERRRREREAALRAEIRGLGYVAYLRKQLLALEADPSVLATLEGFQSNPRGMVQFLELARLKKALSEPVWLESVRLLEEAIVLADPKDPALEALRALAVSS